MDHRIVRKKLEILRTLSLEWSHEIVGWKYRLADNPAVGVYEFDGNFEDVAPPAAFPAGKTVFLQTVVDVPESADLGRTYLSFDFLDLEGLLRVGNNPRAGLDSNHLRCLAPNSGRLCIEIEFQSIPSFFWMPDRARHTSRFFGGAVCSVDREIESFCYDIQMAFETVTVIDDDRRKKLLNNAIEDALLAVNLTLPRSEFLAEVRIAAGIFSEHLQKIAPDPEGGSLYAVGHSHIDTAWLWPLRETVRKCSRTFATACRLMEQYPDFYFACSQPQLYEYVKDYFPSLYAEIQKWVTAGQWDTAGAMWIEADCNVTSGESLIRQVLTGSSFFKREFGKNTLVCWLPDVFGYPSSLPEILAGCGLKYFYTYKLHWQAENPFPNHLFRWRGLDGSEVLAAVVKNEGGYNSFPRPRDLSISWGNYAQKAEYPEIIFPYGFGDGGGGVTEEMIEIRHRAELGYPGLPKIRTGTVEGFFDAVVSSSPMLPQWDGELYVETHRGTYTSQSALKRANRRNELALRNAEIWGSIAHRSGYAYPKSEIDKAWKLVLLNQFHDILPGSSIGIVYDDAHRDHQVASGILAQCEGSALDWLSKSNPSHEIVRVFNSLSWERRDGFTLIVPHSEEDVDLVDGDGNCYPAQVIERLGETDRVYIEGAAVPSLGYADFKIAAGKNTTSTISISVNEIETLQYRISLNAVGAITRIYDKRHSREVIPDGHVANDLQLLQDGPEREDAWNIHETVGKRRYEFDGETTITIVENGPARGVVRVIRRHRNTIIRQDIIVTAGSDRIDFVTRVDWNERNTMLRVAFPLEIRALKATYEVQFGAIERSTHRNTSWDKQKFEVPAHRWADLSEAGYGVSLMNDCRYGYSAEGNTLRLTLLRSTTYPDPLADLGTHEFTYSILPHVDSWVVGETVRRAYELNVPLKCMPVSAQEKPVCFLEISGYANAVVEAIKMAEDGHGHIVRLYEPHGGRGVVFVTTPISIRAVIECNLVEEDGASVSIENGKFQFEIHPFQIRTFRLL